MNIDKQLRHELNQLAETLIADKPDSRDIRSDVKAIAKSYGLGVGYIYNRLTDIVEYKKVVA